MKNESSINLALSIQPEISQSKNPEIYVEFLRLRNALSILQQTLDLYTGAIGADPNYYSQTQVTDFTRLQNISRVYVITSQNIIAGQLINLYNNAGVPTARLANATDATKPCRAFATKDTNSGDFGEFILFGADPIVSGLVCGTDYYLATTDGAFTSVAPVTAGNIVQKVGYGLNSLNMYFTPTLNWIQL